MSVSNENYNAGGMGGAIFGENQAQTGGPKPGEEPIGDDYVAPGGLPGWKQPSFDDDDRVDPKKFKAGNVKSGMAGTLLSRFFPDPVEQGLALAKFFYFFFFAAFGSLFPLMAVYFKQLGMDASQCGFLIGIKPIIEYLATPFWNKMADKFRKGKILLLIAVASWILFTVPQGYIHPPVVSCKYFNGSQYLLKIPGEKTPSSDPILGPERKRRSTAAVGGQVLTADTVNGLPIALPMLGMMAPLQETSDNPSPRVKRDASDHKWAPGYVAGTSPQIVKFSYNYQESKHKAWISPVFSNEVFEKEGVHKVFFLIMLLVIIGEFFSSPAIALADSAVITLLGEEHQDKYGGQRMFGSIGWGFAMFIMGIVLDHSRFDDSKCNISDVQRNYHVCFIVFAVLMFCAFLVATQIPFKYSVVNSEDSMAMHNLNGGPGGSQQQQAQKKREEDQKEKLKKIAEKGRVFAQQLRSMPEFMAVFKAMANLRLFTFMIVAWVMGVGVGLIFTFLFWHLQDFGGGPTLFGIASVINHLSEMAAYFYSWRLINRMGHIKVLAAGLLCNCVRFIYISFITWPWLILPFEFVQGITHAATWAACCSFIAHNTDAELRPSAQGFLQGVHHGFGRFCGAVFGGFLIKSFGTTLVFRAYGMICIVFLVIFVIVNIAQRDEGCSSDLTDEFNPNKLGEMAPHGVPSAPMPRALSSSKLEEDELTTEQQMAAARQGPNLGVPGAAGANNPFLENYDASGSRIEAGASDQSQYYGAGYSQAQSGYSSSGFGLQ